MIKILLFHAYKQFDEPNICLENQHTQAVHHMSKSSNVIAVLRFAFMHYLGSSNVCPHTIFVFYTEEIAVTMAQVLDY